MLTPSPETQKIRGIVEKMSDDDLRSSGPKDLKDAVERLGLNYEEVRNKLSNELARLRRQRGIRKGRGKRIAMEWPTDPEFTQMAETFMKVEGFLDSFETWEEAGEVASELIGLARKLGLDELEDVIKLKLEHTRTAPKRKRRKRTTSGKKD